MSLRFVVLGSSELDIQSTTHICLMFLVDIAWRLNAITFGEKIFCMKTGILHEAKLTVQYGIQIVQYQI